MPTFFSRTKRRNSLISSASSLRRSGDHFRRANGLICSAHHSSYDGVLGCEGSSDSGCESRGGIHITPLSHGVRFGSNGCNDLPMAKLYNKLLFLYINFCVSMNEH